MLFADGTLALLVFALWVFCIIDVITTPEFAVRNLPKLIWLFIVILLFDVGSIAWLIAGRPWTNRPGTDLPYKGNRSRQQPTALRMNGTNPDDDEEFLARLRARAEEQRRRARDGQQGEERSGDDATGA
jgi:hypothetical protein